MFCPAQASIQKEYLERIGCNFWLLKLFRNREGKTMVTMAVPNISKPFFTFVVQKCKLASRSFRLHVVGAVVCCYGHVVSCWHCLSIPQVIFSSTTPDSTNPNAMPTEAASCFPNDNVIVLTTSGLETTSAD